MKRLLACCVLMSAALPALAADKVVAIGLFNGKAMLEIDGKQRMLKVGERSPEGVRLLAADSGSALVEINGEQRRMELGTQIGASYKAAERSEVQIWPDQRNMYRVTGAINGMPVDFLVDTGATTIAMNAAAARRLGIDYRVQGERGMVTTASGVAPVYRVSLNSVTVGAITLHQVEAVVLEGAQPDTVLLGMTFLGRLEMQRDGQVMVLKKKW